MPDMCVVCGNTKSKDRSCSFHRFPKDPTKRSCLELKESNEMVTESTAGIFLMVMLSIMIPTWF